jgi:hypothetical protein
MQVSKILAGLGMLAAVVAVGLGIGWLATRGAPSKAEPAPLVTNIPELSPTLVKPEPSPRIRPVAAIPRTGFSSNAAAVEAALPVALANVITNWEDKLDEILSSDAEDTNKVKQLFTMFPNLPAAGQEEVAQHLSNLVEDDDYSELGKLLADAKLPESVLDVLMGDLLNRPNAAKLPLLLEIVQIPDHSKAGEAKDLLELYLDEDYSADPAKLKQKITDWLKENPD